MKFKKAVLIGLDESKLDKAQWARLDKLVETRVNLPNGSPELNTELKGADCVFSNFFGTSMGRDEIDAAPILKYIGVFATGYGKVDAQYAKNKGIVVCNIPGFSSEAVAEFTFAVLLEHLREVEKAKAQTRSGNYDDSGFMGTEVRNKNFAVIGLGNIGGRVAEIALGFGAQVSYWSRNRKPNYEQRGVEYKEIDDLIQTADILSINISKTNETEDMLNATRLGIIKPGAIVINTSPMELIDLIALEARLLKGDITLILDHADEMRIEDIARLSRYENCIVYPPIAYITKEALIAKQEIFVENVASFLNGKIQNRAN